MNASKLLLRYAAGHRDFRAVSFREANLSRADLHEADFGGADLRQGNLAGSQLWGINFSRANLSGADLKRANLIRANLHFANLWGINAIDSDFTKADLRGADLRGADLTRANLKGADLRGANLQGADLTEVDLCQTDLRGSTLSRAYLYRADLSRANLCNADFKSADLSGVSLTKVRALSTNFEGAILSGVCIQNWYIDSSTNLKNVICDYIYLEENQKERRPSNPYETFASGQFASLFQRCKETLNLTFQEHIDWSAFMIAFKQLQQDFNGQLHIRTMGYSEENFFLIGIDLPLETNKIEIEQSFRKKYEEALVNEQGKEGGERGSFIQDRSHKEQDRELLEIVKLLAHYRISM
ncbi:pentapeptide repeat-containing protein [Oscillatoria sp. FACHB-1406]|uniref:pentapeptide repeat-containing protein n=1 Tax=Oscillatoria sp. FACHB-1406 TaxID=2692846 RepID=UPI001682EAF7|nr:pentapeptide repeat-containing protein [Oscillatoria sp. FACHB-1406]MBD2580367.1 pentapeptide repeat-containing protein [Oscillatoria sp. FACHB-1406]